MLGVFEGFGVITVLIGTGFLLGRARVLGEQGQQVLARLVFYAATPALLYVTLSQTPLRQVFSSALLATGGSALLLGALLFIITYWWRKRSVGEAVFSGWATSYVNIGNLGIPIAAYVLGDISAIAPVLLFQLLVLAPLGMMILDLARRRPGSHWYATVFQVVKNPIVIGAAVGIIASATNWQLPEVLHDPVSKLGDMAVPGALLAFGISLKDGWRLPAAGSRSQLLLITGFKLIAQPGLAWLIGGPLLGYAGTELLAIVVLSTLPVAQNVYIYAMQYRQSEQLIRDAVFITTVLSVPAVLIVSVLLS